MAFPFLHQENFDSGDKGSFDGTTVDGGSALTFPHYRTLAANTLSPMPYRGSNVLAIELSAVDSSGSYVLENTSFDLTSQTTVSLLFYVYISTDLVMAASDTFDIFVLRSASANEVTVSIRNNAGIIEINAGELSGATTRAVFFSTGEWHAVELTMTVDTDGGGDGTIDFYLDGIQVGAQIGTLTQANITNARFGVQAIDAGTTAGSIYFDQIFHDDLRLYPFAQRFQNPRTITDDEQFWVGPGHLALASIVSTAVDNIIRIYDTDNVNKGLVEEAQEGWLIELDPDASIGFSGPLYFNKGCYVELTGTNPRATVAWVENSNEPGVMGPLTISDGMLRNHAVRSKP